MIRGIWVLPRPGIEPVSPALAGRFLTTAPPGKSPSQYLFYFTWEEKQFTWAVMPQPLLIFHKSWRLIQVIKSSLEVLFCCDMWKKYLCSPYQASSPEDSIHMSKLLALKRHNIVKEKIQFAQTQVSYLGHLISEQGPHPDPERLCGVLCFQKPKTKCQLLVVCCQNWTPNFSFMPKTLYVLLSNNNSNPIWWEEQDNIAFKALKESLMNLPVFGHPSYQILFFLLYMKRKGMPWGYSPKNTGTAIDP